MLPKTSRERRRHAVKRIIVEHMKTSKKMNNLSLERVNAKLRDTRWTDESTKSSTKHRARKFLTEYLQDSTVHGIKYLSNLRIRPSIVGKIFWAVTLILSFWFLIWMVNTFWTRYNADPLRTVVMSFQAPIFMIPFPAVTLCPLIPPLAARRNDLLTRIRLPPSMNNETAKFLLKYGVAFASERVPGGKSYQRDLKMLLDFNGLTLLELLKFLRPCEDLMESCWWDGVKTNCSELFEVSYGTQGTCCSFNFLLEKYIGTEGKVDFIKFLRSAYFGPTSGLAILLHRQLLLEHDDIGEYVRYSTNSAGILVYSHHPLEYLGAIANRHIVQAGQELRVAVIPNVKNKLYGYHRRNSKGILVPHCVEKQTARLKYFPYYSISNCYVDCSIRASLQICGCVPFYYEPVAVKYSLKICKWENFRCLYKNADNIRVIQEGSSGNITCKCFSSCKDIYYDTQVSVGVLNGHESNTWSMQVLHLKTRAPVRIEPVVLSCLQVQHPVHKRVSRLFFCTEKKGETMLSDI